MPKISYTGCCLDLSLVISAQFAVEMCVAAQNHQKVNEIPNLAFKVTQGHWLLSAPIKSQCTTSYQ